MFNVMILLIKSEHMCLTQFIVLKMTHNDNKWKTRRYIFNKDYNTISQWEIKVEQKKKYILTLRTTVISALRPDMETFRL